MKKTPVLFVFVLLMLGCSRERVPSPGPQFQLPPPATGFPVFVEVDQEQPGYTVPSDFTGLSFETQILTTHPEFLNVSNTALVQLIKNLGPGVLRIGGNTSDQITWSESNSTSPDSLTKADIDRLAAFSKLTGWPVLFGLNLGSYNTAAAADEALYVRNALGSSLYALQTGNEPDVYRHFIKPSTYEYPVYQADWESYLAAIRAKVPGASFAGPDVANNSDWVGSFAQTEGGEIKLLDAHYYAAGPASDPDITYHTILAANPAMDEYLQIIEDAGAKYRLPYRISECNSVYGGGKARVSDVFASALWALDVMWNVAEHRSAGINFHDGYGLVYSPVTVQDGSATAAPEYYAMLAFAYAGAGGRLIPAKVSHAGLSTAYACIRPDNTCTITLINKDTKDYSFHIQLSRTAASMNISKLTAPSLIATNGVTFGDSQVNADGSFTMQAPEEHPLNNKVFVINVPAGSAEVVLIR